MDDRRFLRLLAIVVASGLAIGIAAFSATRRGETAAAVPPPTAVASASAPTRTATETVPTPDPAAPPDLPLAEQGGARAQGDPATEPPAPSGTPPAMRSAASLDPVGAAGAAPGAASSEPPADPALQ